MDKIHFTPGMDETYKAYLYRHIDIQTYWDKPTGVDRRGSTVSVTDVVHPQWEQTENQIGWNDSEHENGKLIT